MEQSKQPVVYISREIYINEAGKSYTVAYFVSRANLKKATKEYNEDGSVNSEYIVKLDNVSDMYFNDICELMHTENGEMRVNQVFKDYISCSEFVNKLNNNLSLDVYDLPISRYSQRKVLQETALKYAQNLQKQETVFFKG